MKTFSNNSHSSNEISFEDLKKNKNKFQKIFFYRICGTGMSAAACLLQERGLTISGADLSFAPPVSDFLKSSKIPCYEIKEVTDEFLKGFDLIVVGNVVPKGGEDALRIENLGVPYTSFPCALGALILEEQNVVGIAGTHGKTTTTFLITQIFEHLGFEPGHLIGGILENRPPSKLGKGNYFFIESDEYDSSYFQKTSKFHFYCIDHLILTSLEFDHADIFQNVEQIEEQFAKLIPQVKESYIISEDYESCRKLFTEFSSQFPEKNWTLYGRQSSRGPFNIQSHQQGTSFELNLGRQSEKMNFSTNLVGIQNILNLSSCIFFAYSQGIEVSRITEAIKNLKMVKRRQEVKGTYKGALLVDDFAHHPSAVALTLESIRIKYPERKIIVVFEPASATARSNVFQEEFAKSFQLAHKMIVIRPSRKSNIKNYSDINCNSLLERVKDLYGIEGHVVENGDDLIAKIDQELEFCTKTQKGQQDQQVYPLILTLSNGTLLGLWEKILKNENQM